jgi:hypothetical protein
METHESIVTNAVTFPITQQDAQHAAARLTGVITLNIVVEWLSLLFHILEGFNSWPGGWLL